MHKAIKELESAETQRIAKGTIKNKQPNKQKKNCMLVWQKREYI